MARQTPNGWTAYRAAPVPPSVATAALLIGVVGAGLSLLGGVAAIGLGFLNVDPKFAHDQYVRFVFVGTAGSVLLHIVIGVGVFIGSRWGRISGLILSIAWALTIVWFGVLEPRGPGEVTRTVHETLTSLVSTVVPLFCVWALALRWPERAGTTAGSGKRQRGGL